MPRKNLGFHTKFCEFRELRYLRFLKKFFFSGLRSCPNQTKLGTEYHQCNGSVKKKSCWYSLTRRKMVFHTKFCELRELRIFENFKNSCFSSCQGVAQIKPNSVLSITSVMREPSIEVVAIACLGKKMSFHTELFEFREKGILKIVFFHRVKELSKSNQTRYGESPV